MSFRPASPSQEYGATKVDDESPVPIAQPDDDQGDRESSEDDVPLMARRQLRSAVKKRDKSTPPREYRSLRDTGRHKGRHFGGYARDRPILRQPAKTSLKATSKHKKPGPRAWAAKPIMKNDMKAKKEVIREIEGFWGQGFIKAYIPKCHRPLVKGSKRLASREHETDPKNWLPSVLKAILMIAKLTDDKQWLAQAMNDVVRYRIKHTGNRKPQLVTTDFDVIEDMLVKEWDVDYSFEIRYKHLLINRKEEEEDDENIDHILQAGSDSDDSNGDEGGKASDQDTSDDDDDDGSQHQGGISSKCQQSSGYTKAPQYFTPAPSRQRSKQPKIRKETPTKQRKLKQEQPDSLQQQQGMYSHDAHMHGHGLPMDLWGRPMPVYGGQTAYNYGYSGYGGGYGGNFGGPSGYGFTPQYGQDTQQRSQQLHARGLPQYHPLHHAMTPAPSIPDSDHSTHGNNPERRGNKRGRMSPLSQNKRARDGYDQFPGYEMQGYPNHYQSARYKIKREFPVDESCGFEDDLDDAANDPGAENDDNDTQTAADAEVEAMEIELKLAKLKAARLREQQRKKK
jgi:hypothetical protein